MAQKLTQKQQQMVVLAVMLVGGGAFGYWNYLLKPSLAAIQTKTAEFEKLKDDIAKAEKQARRLPALKFEKEKLNKELARLEKQLPKQQDTPNILRTLTREAIQENLGFTAMEPKAVQQRNFFQAIPFQMDLKGTLNSLARFLASLGQNERIFKAENFSMTPLGGDLGIGAPLKITFTITTYSYTGG